MSSPSTVLTGGLGSWGSVNELPTRGLGIAALAAPSAPGIYFRATDKRPHYRVEDKRPHYRASDKRPHFRTSQ